MLTLSEIINQSKLGCEHGKDIYSILSTYCNHIGGSKGLIYIGANTGDELPFCKTVSEMIYAFEPISHDSVWSELIKHEDSKTKCFNYALSDIESTAIFYLASNNYQSSSLYEPKLHITEFPSVVFEGTTTVQTKRLDQFDFVKKCDTLVMDVQGSELKVLNGLSDYSNIKLIILEFISKDTYLEANCFDEIKNKLESLGFIFYEVFNIYNGPNVFVGNAVFLKES